MDRDKRLLYYYIHMVNWTKRLQKEGSFLEESFGMARGKKVLDAGCGIGRHVLYLCQHGFDAHGIDTNASHIAYASKRAVNTGFRPAFEVMDMESVSPKDPGWFDGVMSIGNILASFDDEKLENTLKSIFNIIKPGGVFVGHILNYSASDREDRTDFRQAMIDEKQVLFLKTFHFEEDHVSMIVNTVEEDGQGGWTNELSTAKMHIRSTSYLEQKLKDAGFEKAEFFGGLDGSKYNEKQSKDLVFRAFK